jgi:hypothetical protein
MQKTMSKAMNEMQTANAGWKKKIVHELIEYWINFGYLAFFLVAFMWYRRLVLAEYQIQYTDYWFPLIEWVQRWVKIEK